MENRFDDLTKGLAEGIPRRQALWRLGSLFGAALLGSLALGNKARAYGGNPCGKSLFCGNINNGDYVCCPSALLGCCHGKGGYFCGPCP